MKIIQDLATSEKIKAPMKNINGKANPNVLDKFRTINN